MDQFYRLVTASAVASDDLHPENILETSFVSRTPNVVQYADVHGRHCMNIPRLDTSMSPMQSLAAAQVNMAFPAPPSISPDALHANSTAVE